MLKSNVLASYRHFVNVWCWLFRVWECCPLSFWFPLACCLGFSVWKYLNIHCNLRDNAIPINSWFLDKPNCTPIAQQQTAINWLANVLTKMLANLIWQVYGVTWCSITYWTKVIENSFKQKSSCLFWLAQKSCWLSSHLIQLHQEADVAAQVCS